MSIDRVLSAWPSLDEKPQRLILALVDAFEYCAGQVQEPTVGFFSASQLAQIFKLDPRRTREALSEWRRISLGDGVIESANRARRTPRFLYDVAVLLPLLTKLRRGR